MGTELSAPFNERKNELLAALDAIVARGDKTLADRAAALRKRVEAVQPGGRRAAGRRGAQRASA
jgi:hypothetical protein